MESTAVVAAEVERLRLHVDVGGIPGQRRDLVREEYGGRVEMLAHAVFDHAPQLLNLLFPHPSSRLSRILKKKLLAAEIRLRPHWRNVEN